MVAIHGEGQFLLPLQNRMFSSKLHHYISNLLLDEGAAYEPKGKIILFQILEYVSYFV